MVQRAKRLFLLLFILLTAVSCGGGQKTLPKIETRPLEEGKAASIIAEVLAQRGYPFDKDIMVMVARGSEFGADFKVRGEQMAVEYLTKSDRREIGELPPPGEGSRLHVVNGRTVAGGNGVPSRVFLLLVDDRNFIYHANPTSEVRADVTFLEVDSRLRRDISDFIGWYEDAKKQ